jgi:plastocyanin
MKLKLRSPAVAVGLGSAFLVLAGAAAHGQAAPDTTITIRSTGPSLEFEPAEIAVKQGKRVRLRFANFGTLPHNVAIVRTEDDIEPLAEAAQAASATGYIPVAMKDRMIAYSALALPNGNTVEFTFVVPPPGEYTYICLYPGHHNTMLGTLRSLR